tara:strand:- start:307 stop:648 length:342 start_codon:yes stop_codon:yes gene_type:complete
MNVNQYVSEKVRQFRVEKGLNRVDVADYLHMSISAYGKLESGSTAIDTKRIYLLSQLFNKTFKEFFPPLKDIKEDSALNDVSLGIHKLLESKDKLIGHLETEVEFLRKQISAP